MLRYQAKRPLGPPSRRALDRLFAPDQRKPV